ncbi:MAG: endonuclease/exonuclease/phosphatase family protein [bacterium]
MAKRAVITVFFLFFFISCNFTGGNEVKPAEEDENIFFTGNDEEEIEDENQPDKDDYPFPDEKETLETKIVIATYNTHLFFDAVCDSGFCSSSDFEKQLSPSEYSQKVKDIAEALLLINADIVLLQEIEKHECLQDLFSETGGVYDDFFIGETGASASVDTAVITKGEIVKTNTHLKTIPHPDGGTTTFTRAFLETHISFNNREIIVFSAHFKSKSNDDPKRREAEANAALAIAVDVAKNNPKALVVIGGDLNDTPGSTPISILESSADLLRVASELPAVEQATYYHEGPAAIDHIFFHKGSPWQYIPGSAEVIKDAPSWYSLLSSDHAALRASFEF